MNTDKRPIDKFTEQALLGAMVRDKNACAKALGMLESDDFYDYRNKKIFATMAEMDRDNESTDIITLMYRLKQKKDKNGKTSWLDDVGESYCYNLDENTKIENTDKYIEIVQRFATMRKISAAGNKAAQFANDVGYDPNAIMVLLQKKIDEISQRKQSDGDFSSGADILNDTFANLEEHLGGGEIHGILTGFKGLDKNFLGIKPTDMIILAARPGMGKTALALNFAWNAVKAGVPTAFFSLEMSKGQIMDRVLSLVSGVDLRETKTTDTEKINDLYAAKEVISKGQFYVTEKQPTIEALITQARKMKKLHNIGLFFIDYMQLLAVDKDNKTAENRQQEVTYISRALKALAIELKTPIIALCQLSRGVESRNKKIPMLSDLRESGSIEQDADIVLGLYREDYYELDPANITEGQKNVIQVHILKHRNGPIGKVDLYFHKEIGKFSDIEYNGDGLGEPPSPNSTEDIDDGWVMDGMTEEQKQWYRTLNKEGRKKFQAMSKEERATYMKMYGV